MKSLPLNLGMYIKVIHLENEVMTTFTIRFKGCVDAKLFKKAIKQRLTTSHHVSHKARAAQPTTL